MIKKRTLNELRQVKEYGYNPPSNSKGLAEAEIEKRINIVKNRVYDQIDIEEIIRMEMMEEGLHPDMVEENRLFEAFMDIWYSTLQHLKYNYE